MKAKETIIEQIGALLTKYRNLRSASQYSDLSDLPGATTTSLITSMCECIRRCSTPNSQYSQSVETLLRGYGVDSPAIIPHIAGVLLALKEAYDAGYLEQAAELIHAETFANFLEMTEYLLSEGYKDPAAVIIGSVLEEHLRQLCLKNGLATEVAGKPKKAEELNSDLAGQSVYSKLDQKSVTSWLDLRNKAAHGKYGEYTKDQVAILLLGVQNFLTRNPA
jgi:hypothetical protein